MRVSPCSTERLLVASLIVIGGTAQAEPFAMHSELRNFCCTDWMDRTATPSPAPNGGGAFGFIGGVVVQPRDGRPNRSADALDAPLRPVSACRSDRHAFQHHGLRTSLIDRQTVAVSMDNRAAVLRAGGGPGALEFCPFGPSVPPLYCDAYWPSTPGPDTFDYHGRIAVTAGPNQFGGAMGWLGSGLTGVFNRRNGGPLTATRFDALYFARPLNMVGANTALGQSQPTADGAMAFAPFTGRTVYYSTSQHHANPSAVPLTTDSGTGRATAHVWTTGMVTVSATNGAFPPWMAVTMTGSENRATTGPNIGSGKLSLVTSTLYQDYPPGLTSVRGTSLTLTVPEPDLAIGVGLATLSLVWSGIGRRSLPRSA